MKKIRIVLAMFLVSLVMVSCQDQEDGYVDEFEAAGEVVVTDISAEGLPSAAIDYINEEFAGELVVEAFEIAEATGEIYFESFLTNNLNLTFEADGSLKHISQDSSSVTCDGRKKHRRERIRDRRAGRGDSARMKRERPVEISVEELPEASATYLAENYANSTIRKIMKVTLMDESIIYLAVVEGEGAVIFDADGNFVEVRNRSKECFRFERVAIEDLPETITAYISENYPDGEILRARTGEIKEVAQIHVLIKEVGVLIFDTEGDFIDLKECKPNPDNTGSKY